MNLNQNLACGQQLLDSRPIPNYQILEETIVAISTGEPDQSGRRSKALLDLNKVAVFGDDHRIHFASLLENLQILGPEETEIFNVAGLITEVPNPSCECWRELASTHTGKESPTYAASIGWSRRRAAYWRQAAMSSDSR
jgi:hypothetical protein